MLKRSASRGPRRGGFPRLRNLLICIGMASRKTVLETKLPACQCQPNGRPPAFWRTKELWLGRELFGRGVTKVGAAATQNRAQFRAYAFSTEGWTASFQDVPPLRWGLPQPNWTV